jgi:hypothetical protein
MYKFTGTLKNEFWSEEGVNITVKGLQDERIILAPMGPWYELNKEQEKNTLTFTMAPSSGTTEPPRVLGGEVKKGTEKVTTHPTHWEVEITCASESEPAEVEVTSYEAEYEEEGEGEGQEAAKKE